MENILHFLFCFKEGEKGQPLLEELKSHPFSRVVNYWSFSSVLIILISRFEEFRYRSKKSLYLFKA